GEGALHVHAAGETMAMAAIGVGDIVVGPERVSRTGRDRFLSLAKMGGAVDEAFEIAALDLLLEFADLHHAFEERDPVAIGERRSAVVADPRLARFSCH